MIELKGESFKKISLHRNILITTMFLCEFGLLMILSASGTMIYFKRQLMFVLLGFFVCILAQLIDYHFLFRHSKKIYIFAVILIFLLLTPLGVAVNGATRWLRIVGVQFQVAETLKLGVVVMLSYMVHRYKNNVHRIKLVLWMWLVGGIAAILLLAISNDLSSSIVILGITFCMSFCFTELVKMHLITGGSILFVVGLYVYKIWKELPSVTELEGMSFRVGRLAAWLNPYQYESDQAFQSLQALYAIGSGGLTGKGLGKSLQKFIIPEPHTDMIFSIICEELGVCGVSILFLLLMALIYWLVMVAMQSMDTFGSALVVGVVAHIAVQSIINLCVNMNVFPNTGIALPFISYGGTSVFMLLCEIAICLSVERVSSGLAHIKIFRKAAKKSEFVNTRIS